MSDSLAKEYFLDCYTHTDTIASRAYSEGDWYHRRTMNYIDLWTPFTNVNKEEVIVDADGDTILYISSDNFCTFYYIVPREPSAFDFMMFMNRKNREKDKKLK